MKLWNWIILWTRSDTPLLYVHPTYRLLHKRLNKQYFVTLFRWQMHSNVTYSVLCVCSQSRGEKEASQRCGCEGRARRLAKAFGRKVTAATKGWNVWPSLGLTTCFCLFFFAKHKSVGVREHMIFFCFSLVFKTNPAEELVHCSAVTFSVSCREGIPAKSWDYFRTAWRPNTKYKIFPDYKQLQSMVVVRR